MLKEFAEVKSVVLEDVREMLSHNDGYHDDPDLG
jgi:hypothetical protein